MLQDRISDYKVLTESLKEELALYIVDKKIPLNLRWAFWCNAPKSLKVEGGLIKLPSFQAKGWYSPDAPFYLEKGQTYDMVSFIQEMNEELGFYDVQFGITQEFVNQVMEEVLAINLGTFDFYW
jgi:hypothetical protein